MGRAEWWSKLVFLSAIVYPAVFFLFGYYVAWSSSALREFYGFGGVPPVD